MATGISTAPRGAYVQQAHRVRRLRRLGPHGEGWVGIQTTIALVVLWMAPASAVVDITGATSSLALGLLRLLGGIGIVAGIALFVVGGRALGPSFDIWLRPTVRAHLVTSGPYRLIRHPICTAQALIGLGWATLWLSPPAFVGAIAYGLYLDAFKLRAEEELLDERYPAYAAYRRAVPGRMLPRRRPPEPPASER